MIWIVLAGVAVVVAVAVYASYKRRQKLQAWALASGWTAPARDMSLARRWQGSPFGSADEIDADEAMRGSWDGVPAVSFTYSRTDVSRDSKGNTRRNTDTYHVVALEIPASLPSVEITPEGFGAKIAKLAGAQDLEFESDEFNKTYRVAADDAQTAYAILHPRMMERLLEPDARGVPWRIEGSSILTWSGGSTNVDRIAPRLTLLAAVAAAIPRHVWLDHGYDPAAANVPPSREDQ